MTTLTLRSGDLFSSDAPALAQGVNVQGFMGAGVAKEFRRRFQAMYEAYRAACLNGDLVAGGLHAWYGGPTIYNVASQRITGADASLAWLESSMRLALEDADRNGYDRIALPKIGCGIGGLDWADVQGLLESLAADYRCDLEVWIQ